MVVWAPGTYPKNPSTSNSLWFEFFFIWGVRVRGCLGICPFRDMLGFSSPKPSATNWCIYLHFPPKLPCSAWVIPKFCGGCWVNKVGRHEMTGNLDMRNCTVALEPNKKMKYIMTLKRHRIWWCFFREMWSGFHFRFSGAGCKNKFMATSWLCNVCKGYIFRVPNVAGIDFWPTWRVKH